MRSLGKDGLRSISETQVLCVALCLHVNEPSFSSSFRPNASSVASATTTLIGRLTGLRPTPYKSTTSPTTCECSNTQNHQTQLFIVSIFHNCHVLPCAGSSWCTWLTRTRLSTRVRYVSENISELQLLFSAAVCSPQYDKIMSDRSQESKEATKCWLQLQVLLVQHFNPLEMLRKCSLSGGRSNAWVSFDFFFYWYELVIVLHLRPKLLFFFLFDVLALFSCHKHSWKKRERATVSCRSFTKLHSSVAMNDCFCRIYKHNSRKITHWWFSHEGNISTRLKLVRLI